MEKEKKPYEKISYNREYNANNYERFNYIVPKGKKDIIKSAAARRGISTNAYITMAVDALLQLDGLPTTPDPGTDPADTTE